MWQTSRDTSDGSMMMCAVPSHLEWRAHTLYAEKQGCDRDRKCNIGLCHQTQVGLKFNFEFVVIVHSETMYCCHILEFLNSIMRPPPQWSPNPQVKKENNSSPLPFVAEMDFAIWNFKHYELY